MRFFSILSIPLLVATASVSQTTILQPFDHHCIHKNDSIYMKVSLLEQSTKLSAKITILGKDVDPLVVTREATLVTTRGKYHYFQTPLSGEDNVRQSTYALHHTGNHIYVTNTGMNAEVLEGNSRITTSTYICKFGQFD
jgi:hypothetical protein